MGLPERSVRPLQEKKSPMIGLRTAPREVRAQWFAEFEVGSGTFESSASRWAKCIRVEGGEGFFWSGLNGPREWSGGAATWPLRPQWLYLQRLVSAEDG